ncbi:hypothetical protein MKW92_045036 [Papaver armeniacum]|nr:hypothetical protein MKW92_045036 [Papaver armeniacum]
MAPQIHLHFLVLLIVIFSCCCSVLVQSQMNMGRISITGGLAEPYENSMAYLIRSKLVIYTFGLYFYNTTPDAYVLGIAGGNMGGTLQWIWDANGNHPVRENATLTFATDGNLVLADVDGSVVWHTITANKFVWQFPSSTDTLAVGQSLKLEGNTKLISRTSNRNSHDGPYSIIIDDKKGFIMYQNTSGNLVQYGLGCKGSQVQALPLLKSCTCNDDYYHYQYYSFLRLESDGNLVAYSYIMPAAHPLMLIGEKHNALRSKCGSSGKCYGRLCSACPRNGSLGCMISTS